MYFTFIAHLSSVAKISSEILDLYLDFLKFTVEKEDPYTQLVPYIFNFFFSNRIECLVFNLNKLKFHEMKILGMGV
jgi:hypothetical protein